MNKVVSIVIAAALFVTSISTSRAAVNDFCIDNEHETEQGLFISSLAESSQWAKITYDAGSEQAMRVYNNSAGITVYVNDAPKYAFTPTEPMKTGGGRWWVISDERVKKNILSYTDGMNMLRAIQPRTFNYNGRLEFTPDDGVDQVGVIAQELRRVAPKMVTEAPDLLDGAPVLVVDTSELTFSLINAVKEQQQAIDKLRAKTRKLEALLCAKNPQRPFCK
jgi:hypothetical protein